MLLICPFYTSKENQNAADIIFLPYNYLIDPQTREAQSINLSNAILIFDEAHNLESYCEEAYSFELTLSDIKQAITEMEHCLNRSRIDTNAEFNISEFNRLKLKLEIFKTKLSDCRGVQIQPGRYMYELFQIVEINFDNAASLMMLIESATNLLSSSGYKSKNISRYGLALFNDALKIVFRVLEKDSKDIENYKVHIECKETITAEKFAPVKKNETVLSFWCFSAQVAMKAIEGLGTRSIILASGTLINRSGRSSIIRQLEEHKKVYVEPKSKSDFVKLIEKYNQSVKESGAILFAVCRGKASEGIDFSDDHCRAVLICGIPFPALKDPKVELKKKILASKNSKSGDSWYAQQAYRAVNQAIGRVIRHRNDYGAIILLDNRFSSSWVQNNLPIWIRHHINVAQEYGQMNLNLVQFFKKIKEHGFDYAPSQSGGSHNSKNPLYFDTDAGGNDPMSYTANDRRTSVADKWKANYEADPNDPLSISTNPSYRSRLEVDKNDPMYISPKKQYQKVEIDANNPLYVASKRSIHSSLDTGEPMYVDPNSIPTHQNDLLRAAFHDPLSIKPHQLSLNYNHMPRKKHVMIEYQRDDPLAVPKEHLQIKLESMQENKDPSGKWDRESPWASNNVGMAHEPIQLSANIPTQGSKTKNPAVAINFNEKVNSANTDEIIARERNLQGISNSFEEM
ncbi:hypothetical protein HDV01_004387 [Terramyces sp. JEL0728]|nr:hypothetical protein HDV01_004387 [Terramyces sp. JEL0728]